MDDKTASLKQHAFHKPAEIKIADKKAYLQAFRQAIRSLRFVQQGPVVNGQTDRDDHQ